MNYTSGLEWGMQGENESPEKQSITKETNSFTGRDIMRTVQTERNRFIK